MSNSGAHTGKNILHHMYKISLYELHNKTAIPYNQLLRWNKGVRQFDISMLLRLSKFGKITPGEFVDRYLDALKEKPKEAK